MEIEKCRALLCALEEGTLAGVADILGYTVSGISRMIASLEEETGFPLLYRGRTGVSPTKECETLLPSMRQMVYYGNCYRQTADSLRGLEQGVITVGTSYGVYLRQLAKLIAQFRKRYPAIVFRTIEGTSSELTAAVNEHRADLCIVSKRDDVRNWICLTRDELLVMLSPTHPLAKSPAIPLECLESEEYIDIYAGKETDNSRCLAKHHIQLTRRFACVEDVFSAVAMVEAGIGITLMNAIIANSLQGNITFRPLSPPQYVDIGIVTHLEEAMSPAARCFVEFVKNSIEK